MKLRFFSLGRHHGVIIDSEKSEAGQVPVESPFYYRLENPLGTLEETECIEVF